MLSNNFMKLIISFNALLLFFFSSFLLSQDDIGEDFEDIVFVYHGYGNLRNWGSNYGLITGSSTSTTCCSYMYYQNTLHNSQNAWVIGFVFAVEDNVIEAHSLSSGNFWPGGPPLDWMPVKESAQEHFNPKSGYSSFLGRPYVASSDIPVTWPLKGGEAYWPGRMKPGSSESDRYNVLAPFSTSSRDIFYAFDDRNNAGKDPLGLRVEVMSYDYGVAFAAGIIFYDYLIINTSDKDIKDGYAGWYVKLGMGFSDNLDYYLGSLDSDQDGEVDVIYSYDPKFYDPKGWNTNSRNFGMKMVKSPLSPDGEELGMTDFHVFKVDDQDIGPKTDEGMWPIISSNPDDPDIEGDPSFYFHGDNVRIDDTDWIPETYEDGAMFGFFMMSGPFDLAAGDSTRISVGFVLSPDHETLKNDVVSMQEMADNDFLGPSPPPAPSVTGVASDGKVTLYWDNGAETDPNFEGYRVFRRFGSNQFINAWGKEVLDLQGNIVGHIPLAQYDKINGVKGRDPFDSYINLGSDTGLKHSFVDTNVTNGLPYVYAVTSYSGPQLEKELSSLESPIGSRGGFGNTAYVVPFQEAIGVIDGSASEDTLFPVVDLQQYPDDSYYVKVNSILPNLFTGHEYEITFTDTVFFFEDTLYEQGFSLFDVDSGEFLVENMMITDESGDNTPIVGGVRLDFLGRNVQGTDAKWVYGSTAKDGADFPYWNARAFGPAGDDIFEITITADTRAIEASSGYGSSTYQIPLEIINATTGEDLSSNMFVVDMIGKFTDDDEKYGGSPGSWDLLPGGDNWNPVLSTGTTTYEKDADKILIKNDEGKNLLLIYTIHPPDGIPPSIGDKFYVGPTKPFPRGQSFRFSTIKSIVDPDLVKSNLDQVRVVPNPYLATAAWDIGRATRKLAFVNLPPECTIDIFNVAGEHVYQIDHKGVRSLGTRITPGAGRGFTYTRETKGVHEWEMINKNQLEVASGMYIYVVTTPEGHQTTGKFAVIR